MEFQADLRINGESWVPSPIVIEEISASEEGDLATLCNYNSK